MTKKERNEIRIFVVSLFFSSLVVDLKFREQIIKWSVIFVDFNGKLTTTYFNNPPKVYYKLFVVIFYFSSLLFSLLNARSIVYFRLIIKWNFTIHGIVIFANYNKYNILYCILTLLTITFSIYILVFFISLQR